MKTIPTQPTTTAGRHAGPRASYLEEWAQRYPKGQLATERNRLRAGMAKHRAHRVLLPATPPRVAA